MLLSQLEDDPNTITSSLQRASLGLEEKPKKNPLHNLLASVMRGNALVQGQAAGKKAAESQASGASRAKLTLNADGTVDMKNAPPDMLLNLNSGAQEVDDATAAPHLAVESRLSGGAQPEGESTGNPLEASYKIIDSNVGYRVPRPWDGDIAEKLKTPDGIRTLTREMGGSRDHAAKVIKALASGQVTPDYMRERVAAYRTQKAAAMFKPLEGMLNESQDIASRTTTEAGKKTKEADDARKERYGKYKTAVTAIDYSLVEGGPEEWIAATEAEIGDQIPEAEKKILTASITRKGTQDVSKALEAFMNKDKDQLAVYDSFDKAKEAFGRPLTAQQEKQFNANWTAARDAKAEKERQIERADAKWRRTLDGKPDRPTKIPQWQADNLPVDSLLSALNDPDVEQGTARRAVETRLGRLTERHDSLLIRGKQNEREHAQVVASIADLEGKIKKDPRAPNVQTALNQLQARRRHLEVENYGINQQRTPLAEDIAKINGHLTKGGEQGIEFVSRDDWDKLIAMGETKQSLAKQGIRLKK